MERKRNKSERLLDRTII